MRKIAVCIGVVAATMALAAIVIVGAKGTGGAVNAAGVKWGFAMDAKKATNGNEVRVSGFCNVRREFRDGEHNMLVTINMPKAERFEVGNDIRGAKFTGHALRRVSRDGVVIREDRGVMAVSVMDRREANTAGDRDTLSFNYRPTPGTNVAEGVSFSGYVHWGDIDVYRRVE